jgi:hypothetical protein
MDRRNPASQPRIPAMKVEKETVEKETEWKKRQVEKETVEKEWKKRQCIQLLPANYLMEK